MITNYSSTSSAGVTTITVTSSLTGTIYFHWYMDGEYLGMTLNPRRTIFLDGSDQGRVTVLDTNSSTFDPIANAPAGYSAKRTLTFTRSVGNNVGKYRIEQQRAAGAWMVLGYVAHDPRRWAYTFLTPRLDDLTSYAWRVVTMDLAGNDGTTVSLGAELIVRSPDAPRFGIAFNAGVDKVTFSSA